MDSSVEHTHRFELRQVFRMDLTGSAWSATQRTDREPWHEELRVRVVFIDTTSGLVVFEDEVDDKKSERWIAGRHLSLGGAGSSVGDNYIVLPESFAEGSDAHGNYWPIPISQTTDFDNTVTVRPIS